MSDAIVHSNGRLDSVEKYDVAIVGGGIYGCLGLLEASRRGLTCILLEQGDIGSGTTANSYRTLHGGLRSLQSADLVKFFESVAERRWFLTHFPNQTKTNRFIMPLQNSGYQRPWLMSLAGMLNDLMSGNRNSGVAKSHQIPSTGILAMADYLAEHPVDIDTGDSKYAFQWTDGHIIDPDALLHEVVNWAQQWGGQVREHVRVDDISLTEQGLCLGVHNTEDSSLGTYKARTAIDATGFWQADWDSTATQSQHFASLAWNLVLDLPAISQDSIAYVANRTTYFLRNFNGKLAVGTGHCALTEPLEPSQAEARVEPLLPDFLNQLNIATGLCVKPVDVGQILAGILPVTSPGATNLAVRPELRTAMNNRLFQVSGVKFTTARAVMNSLVTKLAKAHFPQAHAKPYASRK